MSEHIVTDVTPKPIVYGGDVVPGLCVTVESGEEICLAFPDMSRYGRTGLNMFMEVLEEDARKEVEQALVNLKIISVHP